MLTSAEQEQADCISRWIAKKGLIIFDPKEMAAVLLRRSYAMWCLLIRNKRRTPLSSPYSSNIFDPCQRNNLLPLEDSYAEVNRLPKQALGSKKSEN
ncbi:putative disease resistance RPP13-like protein 1 [Gossypium australe]|uniref:Putative disease resistance RPP13-like protein 1 n=1 Tax=Gossypium australe TaxID=47621 RepID=A0A5B6VJQ1_9ROSI|nr:putative disease resistance RPP13-like protein 1 [Gossypium australe]